MPKAPEFFPLKEPTPPVYGEATRYLYGLALKNDCW
jgi:hypothetical protein